ncbi:MAG: type 4a pilus biogenesis protein PilO [Deltaproteobacteria bacterium]|nr:type 4a pilus biogenesis protein PilO [Deltaproteobacteria bacterium]
MKRKFPEILRLLSKLAGISGIEMIEFKVLPEARKTLYSEIPIEMQLKGGFHNIAIFFDKIGKQDRIINISNVKIASPTKETGETIVTTSCTATAFRFLPIAQQPPAQ